MINRAPALGLKPGLTLYLIRHGETDWNREARYQGQRDIPLNTNGHAQAKRHGELLKRLVPDPSQFEFVSSPLGRAAETMRIIRTGLGLPPESYKIVREIMELSYGHWEGKLASELPQLDPVGLRAKTQDPFGWRPHGGESYEDLETRVADWLSGLTRNTIAVSHGGVSRVARGTLFEIKRDLVPFLAVPQDKILRLGNGTMEWL